VLIDNFIHGPKFNQSRPPLPSRPVGVVHILINQKDNKHGDLVLATRPTKKPHSCVIVRGNDLGKLPLQTILQITAERGAGLAPQPDGVMLWMVITTTADIVLI